MDILKPDIDSLKVWSEGNKINVTYMVHRYSNKPIKSTDKQYKVDFRSRKQKVRDFIKKILILWKR